ncbi:MAG TPA: hypothetical protein VMI32_16525 [Candidatus Solibacter sp.]|nr:hypothetical protein [Candidatus Solibacter sp.]
MAKILSAACVLLLFLTASPQEKTMAKYKAVETYEVRPGILMFPSYSEEGQVCQIGLERRHYSPQMIRLDSTLARKDVDEVVDELAPASERGPKSQNPLDDLIHVVGPGMTTFEQYENITVQIESTVIANSKKKSTVEDVAAVIIWKHRKCKEAAAAPSS